MATAKTTEQENDWGAGDNPNSNSGAGQANGNATTPPASPKQPRSGAWNFPPNASRDDCLRIAQSAEAELKKNPDYPAAKTVLAEANERLRKFTPSGLAVPSQKDSEDEDDSGGKLEATEETWPNNPRDARKLHAQIKAEPIPSKLSTRAKLRLKAVKRRRLSLLGEHIMKLEGGLPTIHLTANDQAKSMAFNSDNIRNTKLQILARTIPEVKSLLAELEEAKKGNKEINMSLADAAATIAGLQKENAELHELLKKA